MGSLYKWVNSVPQGSAYNRAYMMAYLSHLLIGSSESHIAFLLQFETNHQTRPFQQVS